MTHLTSCRSRFEANILAARLGADGIVTETRSSLGPSYPLGKIDVYVEEGAFQVARQLLLPVDPEQRRNSQAAEQTEAAAPRIRWHDRRWVRAAALATILAALVSRVL